MPNLVTKETFSLVLVSGGGFLLALGLLGLGLTFGLPSKPLPLLIVRGSRWFGNICLTGLTLFILS